MILKWFPQGSLRRMVARNTLSQLIGRVVSSVAIVIVSLLIAKRYGPDGYGDFVKITTYVGFFYLLADFGLNAIYLQRAVGRHESRSLTDPTWQMLLGVRLVMSALLVLVALLLLSAFPAGLGQGYTALVRFGIMILTPAIIVQAITTTTNAFFQKTFRYDLSTIALNAGSIGMLLIAVLLSFATSIDGPLLGVISVFFGGILTAVVALILLRKYLSDIRPIFQRRSLTLFTDAIPLGLALVFNLIYFHADSVILALNRSTREVGIYGLAFKVFELPLTIPIFFMNAVYPVMVKNQTPSGLGISKHVFRKSLIFLFISSLFISAALWICAPLLRYVRADFVDSIVPFRILILSLPVFFVSAVCMWFVIAYKGQLWLMVIHGVAMSANILANIMFIPKYGYIASAWITIYSELFVLGATIVLALSIRMKGRKGAI